MSQVSSFFGLLEQLQSDAVSVNQNRCVAVRNRNATCTRCAEACTSGCIAYSEGELVVSPGKCVGCGTCATICPTGALEARRPSDAELLRSCIAAACAADGEAIIVCEQMLAAADGLYDPEKVVGVGCLGRVDESLLIALAAADVKHVSLVKAKCSSCERSVGLNTAQQVHDTAMALLEAWGGDLRLDIVDKFPSIARISQNKGYDARRREFFSSIKDEARTAAVVTADYAVKDALGVKDRPEPKYVKVMEDGTLPHFVPNRRERLLESLAELGDPEDVMIGTRLWGHAIIDSDLCSSCQMCATFCPTGAISKFKDENGVFGVDHVPRDCVKCRCCVDICERGAIALSDEVFAVDLLSGAAERYEMKPMKNPLNDRHRVLHVMKDLMECDQVYER